MVTARDAQILNLGVIELAGGEYCSRGTQRKYSSKPLKHSIVKIILVFEQ